MGATISAVMGVKNWVMDGYIGEIIELVGAGPLIARGYYGALYGLSDGTVTVSVEDAKATFNVSSAHQYRRVESVLGEREGVADMLSEIEQDDIVYDIGAHVGVHACLLNDQLPSGSVHCFEPNPRNVRQIRSHARLNDQSMTIHQVALSDSDGEITLTPQDYGVGEGGRIDPDATNGDKVRMVDGDEYFRNNDIPYPNVVKIDVEGAELNVLRGLSDSLESCRVIYCEVHPHMMPDSDTPKILYDELDSMGFDIVDRDKEGTGIVRLKAVHN